MALGNENDFSRSARLENLFVRARSLGKWHFLADDGTQRAILQAGDEPRVDLVFFRRRNAPQREAPGGRAAQHEVPRIDGDLASIANDDHAAIHG